LQGDRSSPRIGDVHETKTVPQEPAVLRKARIAFEVVDAAPGLLAVERAGDFRPGIPAHLLVLCGNTFLRPDDRLGSAAVAGRQAKTEAAEALVALGGAHNLYRLVDRLNANGEVELPLQTARRMFDAVRDDLDVFLHELLAVLLVAVEPAILEGQ